MTTFSLAFSSLMNSLKSMETLRPENPVAPFSGRLPVILGGVSSYAPPSGLPIAAQPDNAARASKANAALKINGVMWLGRFKSIFELLEDDA